MVLLFNLISELIYKIKHVVTHFYVNLVFLLPRGFLKRITILILHLYVGIGISTYAEAFTNDSYQNRFYKIMGASALWIWSESHKAQLASEHCKWCTSSSMDSYFRDHLRWGNTKNADQLSNVLTFGVLPLTGLLAIQYLDSEFDKTEAYFLLAESVIYSSVLNQMTKYLVVRERPFVHQLAEDEKLKTKDPNDNNLSFYSGHTNMAFSIAAVLSQTTLKGSVKFPNMKWGLYGLATTAGYLRIAADKHYISDVLVGAITGSLFSYSLTQERQNSVQVFALPTSLYLAYQF